MLILLSCVWINFGLENTRPYVCFWVAIRMVNNLWIWMFECGSETPRACLVLVCARIELAETLEVSGGTHEIRGETLTRVRLGKSNRIAWYSWWSSWFRDVYVVIIIVICCDNIVACNIVTFVYLWPNGMEEPRPSRSRQWTYCFVELLSREWIGDRLWDGHLEWRR